MTIDGDAVRRGGAQQPALARGFAATRTPGPRAASSSSQGIGQPLEQGRVAVGPGPLRKSSGIGTTGLKAPPAPADFRSGSLALAALLMTDGTLELDSVSRWVREWRNPGG